MRTTFKRLKDDEKSIFSGILINRLKPIKFKLNGIEIKAFEGDSILSGAIANNIISAGTHKGHELALDETLSLPIIQIDKNYRAENLQPKDILPIERTPAIDNAQYISIGSKTLSLLSEFINNIQKKNMNSLGINFNETLPVSQPWLEQEADESLNADLIIIGAGIAGMSAASHVANSKKNVILLEQRPYCGGDAILFGHSADEENPKDIIQRFKHNIDKAKNIRLMTSSKAIDIKKNIVRVHSVELIDGRATSKIYLIKAKKIILASGCDDRLPIFPGNRMAGTIGMCSAFHLAYAYGVWPADLTSKASAITTSNNIAYRFATLASDAGATINKIIDTRLEPNSRFSQFAKAYGIKTETGLKPEKITIDSSTKLLNLHSCLTHGNETARFSPIKAKNIIIAGGWIPRLFLWHIAGGKVKPTEGSYGLNATGSLSNIALAGSCANWSSTQAVCQSGINAFNSLFRRKTTEIIDKRIDPIFETLGDNISINIIDDATLAPHYYDRASSLTCQSSIAYQNNTATNKFLKKLTNSHKKIGFGEILSEKTLSLADLSAAYILKKLPASDFSEIAQQRVIIAENLCQTKQAIENQVNKKPTPKKRKNIIDIPNYLEGRFGEKAKLWEVSNSEKTQFETGNLIYTSSDNTDPMQAIGVIVNNLKDRNIALLSASIDQPEHQISIFSHQGHKLAKTKAEYITK